MVYENISPDQIPHPTLNRWCIGRVGLAVYYILTGASYEVRDSGWSVSSEEDGWEAVVKTGPGFVGRAINHVGLELAALFNLLED